MSFIDLIKTRRNTKSFKPDPISMDQLYEWLEAGTLAPNHRMTEPWEVLIVGDETRQKLNHKTNFHQAPLVLAVLSKDGRHDFETKENALATACFIQNFQLAAWAEEGVCTFWSSMGSSERNRDILGVPDNYDVIGLFGVGYPVEHVEPKTRIPIQQKVKQLP
ncbi:nitroreductase [Gracilibacillus halophilus YIM-C55.5]|uniref:Nitroreductase n=1 Tax=Gracilibacillus halophilus YIM-C55.5 TaxID=1308866 RepID=N4WQ79_9BACI|nr:nitroreductase [Gracilibacillus halophilus]ENH98297.1 nitroreductase [Gracilibacillus halophilus YIM-C55.5]